MGTNGLMIPHVQSAEFARRAIERIKYPPLGRRELENVNADADFGLMPLEEYLRAANDETLVVVQIEDLEAAAQADAIAEVPIAEVPGVDMLFVGPADLALSPGLPGECRHPKVLDVIRRVVRACEANGKVCGTPALEPDHCRLLIDEGVRYLTDSSDWRMLVTGFRARRDAYADLGFTFRPERSRG